MKSVDSNCPLKVFLCHAHADRDAVRGLYARLTQDGVDAWLDKAKLHGERSRTILPGQDWELEIRKAKQKRPFAERFAFTISSVLPETS